MGAELVIADPAIAEGGIVEVLDSAHRSGDMLHNLGRRAGASGGWVDLLELAHEFGSAHRNR